MSAVVVLNEVDDNVTDPPSTIRRNYNNVQDEGVKNVTFGTDKLELKNRVCFKGRVKPEVDKSEGSLHTHSLTLSFTNLLIQSLMPQVTQIPNLYSFLARQELFNVTGLARYLYTQLPIP